MKRWEIVLMAFGALFLLTSAVFFGASPVNFVGAAMILFPPVLFLVRWAEEAWRGEPS